MVKAWIDKTLETFGKIDRCGDAPMLHINVVVFVLEP